MNKFPLSLNPAQLNRLFPYFILLDGDMRILSIGEKLDAIHTIFPEASFFEYFEGDRSGIMKVAGSGQPATIKIRSSKGEIYGSWENADASGELFFAGTAHAAQSCHLAEDESRPTATSPDNTVHTGLPILPITRNFDSLIGSLGFGFIEIDENGRIGYVNDRFCSMSGYDRAKMLSQIPEKLFDNESFSDDYLRTLSVDKNSCLQEIVFTDAQGKQRLWLAGSTEKYSEKGNHTGSAIICFDVSEHKSLEQELISAKKDAERTADIKAMFLANMSHEIRTPMNAIINMTGLLSKTRLTDEQDYFLQTIQTASKSLLVIIDDILDLSKIDAGKLKLEQIGFSLSNVFTEVMKVVAHKAENRGLEIHYFPTAGREIFPILIGDPYRITQVVLNLMTNAVKFTEKGSVLLTAIVLDEDDHFQEIEVLVKDTGIGMDPEFLNRLFDNFSQEYESVTRRYGGTGLGLSISHKLVAQMGGYFKVQSEKNAGSEISFIVKFAKGQAADLPKEAPIVHQEDLLAGRTILIVDDNEMNRLVASTVLLGYGPQVKIAENGEIALAMLEQEAYDIILMDIQMPLLNGYDTTKTLRDRGYTGTIIALTASAIEGEREKCIASGMDDYIAKPINEELLIRVIDKWIQKKPLSIISTESVPAQPLYNLDGLRTISKGREDFVTKMMEMFCGQIPGTLDELNIANSAGDFEQLSKLAHKLKSTIDHLAIFPLQRTIREIESIGEQEMPQDELDKKIMRVNQVLGQVLAELNTEIDTRNSE